MELSAKDLDRSQRIGKHISEKIHRHIIVKSISYNDYREIFNNKKRLKRTSVSFTDSLTAVTMLQLKKCKFLCFTFVVI